MKRPSPGAPLLSAPSSPDSRPPSNPGSTLSVGKPASTTVSQLALAGLNHGLPRPTFIREATPVEVAASEDETERHGKNRGFRGAITEAEMTPEEREDAEAAAENRREIEHELKMLGQWEY